MTVSEAWQQNSLRPVVLSALAGVQLPPKLDEMALAFGVTWSVDQPATAWMRLPPSAGETVTEIQLPPKEWDLDVAVAAPPEVWGLIGSKDDESGLVQAVQLASPKKKEKKKKKKKVEEVDEEEEQEKPDDDYKNLRITGKLSLYTRHVADIVPVILEVARRLKAGISKAGIEIVPVQLPAQRRPRKKKDDRPAGRVLPFLEDDTASGRA